jgi:type IV secretory pathway TraG/TraD family ATPase VirD4
MRTPEKQPSFRHPLLSWGLAAVAIFATVHLLAISKTGNEWTAPAAMLCSVFAIAQFVRACNDYDKLRKHKRKFKLVAQSAKLHGMARFANSKDLKKAKLIGDRNQGIFLGTFKGKDLWYDGENSGHLYAPPGAGKTSCCLIPTLLAASARTKKERAMATSFLITDPATEIYSVTHQALRNAGYDVVVLSSWAGEISQLTGLDIVDEKLNFYNSFDPTSNPSIIRDESKLRVNLLIPSEKPDTDEKTKFFNRGGRSLIECISLFEYAHGRIPDFVSLHERVMAGEADLQGLLMECMDSHAFGGYLSSLASGLSGIMNGASEQFAGYLGVAMQALEPFDRFSSVGSHVQGSGFDVGRFKGDKPVAVFLMYPGKRTDTHQSMYNAELSFLLEMICADLRERRVTALIDEAAGIGYSPNMATRFLNQGRKYRLRMLLAWQDLSGQAELIYGKAGMKQILAAGDYIWASGIREPESCKSFAEMAGVRAREEVSMNDRMQLFDQNYSLSHRGVPLIRDVRTELQSDECLISFRNLPIIKAKKVPYFKRRKWSSVAGKNPYAG